MTYHFIGLQETRRILRETLEWPTKYAAIFAKCPLRLRSGYVLKWNNEYRANIFIQSPPLWLSWLRQNTASLGSIQKMWLKFHWSQRARTAEQVYRRK